MIDIPNVGQNGVLVRLHSPIPDHLEVGDGQHLVISGDCLAPGKRVRSISLRINERVIETELSAATDGVAFWQSVFFVPKVVDESVSVKIEANLGNENVVLDLGRVVCRKVDWKPVQGVDPGPGGLVAICMATYNPELRSFERQIDSIYEQSHQQWICIVNDDGSETGLWKAMQEYVSGDGRFHCFQNTENLGFYRNFEMALKRVPDSAEYVALSDQDDVWYPDKLKSLVERLRAEPANLAYSDMRIVDEQEREIASSYWVNRKNEYRDLAVVLVANTVTGAASLFRADILKKLVPFPPGVGDAFHDHWLACMALSTGSLSYIDEPLYSYYQYGDSVIGHCDFTRFTARQRVISVIRFVSRLLRPRIAGPLIKQKYASALAIYRGECRRLRLTGRTIRCRCRVDPERERQLRLFDGGFRSLAALLALHVKVLFKGKTTDDAELRLAMGELARLIEKWRLRARNENSR